MVSLRHLKNLAIFADLTQGHLLDHLSIPAGASLVLDFDFSGQKFPLPDSLPKTIKNLTNRFRVTAVNLCFDERLEFVRQARPSGEPRTASPSI